MIDEKTHKVVDKEEKGRGYEVSKGRYVEIEEDELKAVEIESTHTIDIDTFVPASEIDATAIAQSIKDAEEDLADADTDGARDKARERLEQLNTLKAALGH